MCRAATGRRCWRELLALPLQAVRAEFDVRTANIRLADGAWTLCPHDYHLTDKALAALDNGVMLTFSVEMCQPGAPLVAGSRSGGRQAPLAPELRALTSATSCNTGRSGGTSHATLFGARALGRVQSLPIADADRSAKARLTTWLCGRTRSGTLPGPLQVLTFWDGGFSLE